MKNKISCYLLFSCLTPIQVDATTSLQLMEPSASMSDIHSHRICMSCTLMCRLRVDTTRVVELGLARAWITTIVGIIRRRTRVCKAFSFAATELTFFLFMDPGMGSSRRIMSCLEHSSSVCMCRIAGWHACAQRSLTMATPSLGTSPQGLPWRIDLLSATLDTYESVLGRPMGP